MFFGTVGSIPGGLASADCAPSEGPGSSGDNATSNGDNTVGDYGDVQQPSGNAKDLESYLESWLDINGKKIKGYTPLAKAMIMAQCNHESGGFTKMTEVGSDEYFISGINRGKKVHNGYDINSQFADGRKRARMMGNTKPGDGKKYRGRGFLGLTWKNSYRNCGDYIKKPLEQNPDLASTKEVAAEILIWYFNTQRPKIGKNNQWGDVLEVSMAINGYISKERIAQGKRPLGFEDRKKKFAFYRNKYKV
jgi:putative chitinase